MSHDHLLTKRQKIYQLLLTLFPSLILVTSAYQRYNKNFFLFLREFEKVSIYGFCP